MKKKFAIKTKYGIQNIIVEKDTPGFMVTGVDIPGVVTWGKTLIEAKKMAVEALELGIEAIALEQIQEKALAEFGTRASVRV